MRKIIFLLMLLILVSLNAQQYRQELNQYRQRVAIKANSSKDLNVFKKAAIDIDYCSVFDGTNVYAYATPEEQALLKHLGYELQPAPVIIGKNTRDISYHTHETVTSELQELADRYPQIAKLYSIGKSVENRDLWVIKISDNVDQDEPEPEVKYVSTMHGDEVVGQEMMIYLVRHLLENYGKESWITQLVNDLEIWIMPNMNPDGTYYKRRYNAKWIDLNRNFPDVEDDISNDPTGRAQETQLMMKFTAAHNFCISINFHGGAVVANYAWDTMPGDAPDVKLIKHLALGYSQRNAPMYSSTSFPQGITNGYDWYEVDGGMQDWNYNWHNDLELTLELSQRKWPDASTLPQYWEDNRESLLWFLGQSRRGINGVVIDALTKKPVMAQVNVVEIGKPIIASQLHGDYHRVLMPGSYTLKITAPGYQTATYSNVVVTDNETKPTVLNVELQPLAR